MSEASVLFRKFKFTHGDKAWELPRPNLATEGAFATFLEKTTSEFLARNRTALGSQSYQDALRIHLASATNNWFGWCRPGFIEAMNNPTNAAKFLWLWFSQVYNKDGDPLTFTEESMQVLYREPDAHAKLNELIGEATNDPNPLPLS